MAIPTSLKAIFKKLSKFIPFAAILILSLLPVFYTRGRLPIWGDTIIPFNSQGLEKYLYQWNSVENGQYFSLNYFPYFLFFKIIELFTNNIYFISAVLLFFLKIIAGLGIYKLSKFFYGEVKEVFYTLPVVFYLLSPAQLNASYYLYVYSFAPWFIYFIFKIIKRNRVTIQDLIWVSVILFFSSINLPNPKYIFHLFIVSITILIASLFLKFINTFFILRNFGKLIIFFLLSAYLFLPQLCFIAFYSPQKYDVHIKAGYQDEGQMMDFGESTLQHMFKLHKDSINLNADARDKYNSNALVNFLSYILVILVIAGVVFPKKKDNNLKKYQYILLLLIVVYLFFTSGPNPPLGFLYERMIEVFPLLAFLRTTAGAVFFLSIFYALLLFPIVLNQKAAKKQSFIFLLLIVAVCILGYPILSGDFYRNVKFVNPKTDTSKHGFIIPKDYFDIQEQLNSIKTDVRVLYIGTELSYINTDWGYFGPPIYNFIYNSYNIDCKNIIANSSLHNVGFIFIDKSAIGPQDCSPKISENNMIRKTNFIELSRISKDLFVPHFYIPQNIIYSSGNIGSLADIVSFGDYQIRSEIYLEQSTVEDIQILEKVDEVFIYGKLANAVSEEELRWASSEVILPYIRQRPGSRVYPLVLKKEEYEKWQVRNKPEDLFEKHLFYASKRIAELGKWGEEKDIGYGILDIYQKEMEGALGILKELKQDRGKDFSKLLAKYEEILWGQRAKIKEIGDLKDWDNTFNELERQAEELKIKRDFSKLAYKLDVPKEGEYEIFVKEINGLTDYSLLGKKYFEKGTQELILPMSGISENLVDENLKIKSYSPNSIYRISFDYQAPRGGSFFVAEGKAGELAETNLRSTDNELKHFEMFFRSSVKAEEGNIHLSLSIAQEENLKVERIYQPEMVLRLNNTDTRNQILDTRKAIPKITFVKINPTKYKVKVEGAKEPYNLVFSESFHQGWKAYINGVQSSKFKVQSDYGEILASYFDGEIKEGTHKNIFLERATFETWGRKPLPEGRHLLVNGYANSWYIKPEDAGGQENYELIIEFWPQRLFYLGFGISLTTLLGCLGYLGIGFFENSVKLKVR